MKDMMRYRVCSESLVGLISHLVLFSPEWKMEWKKRHEFLEFGNSYLETL